MSERIMYMIWLYTCSPSAYSGHISGLRSMSLSGMAICLRKLSYYITRVKEFKAIFFINLGINFLVPFFGLITFNAKRQIGWVASIAAVMLAGHWIDYWLMIMPAAAGEKAGIGILEICMTAAYAGTVYIYSIQISCDIGRWL